MSFVSVEAGVHGGGSFNQQKTSQGVTAKVNLSDHLKKKIRQMVKNVEGILLYFALFSRIFSCLDVVSLCRCAQVSKAWNILALDGSNWQRIDLFDFQRDVEVCVFKKLAP